MLKEAMAAARQYRRHFERGRGATHYTTNCHERLNPCCRPPQQAPIVSMYIAQCRLIHTHTHTHTTMRNMRQARAPAADAASSEEPCSSSGNFGHSSYAQLAKCLLQLLPLHLRTCDRARSKVRKLYFQEIIFSYFFASPAHVRQGTFQSA